MEEVKNYKIRVEIEKAAELGISGLPMLLYFAIANYNKVKPCKMGLRKMAERFRIGTKNTVDTALKELINKGLVKKFKDGYVVSGYETEVAEKQTEVSENKTVVSENKTELKERSKENINNTNESNQIQQEEDETEETDGPEVLEDFNLFWSRYNCASQFSNRYTACYELWKQMDESDRAAAIEYTDLHEKEDNPYFWLQNLQFWDKEKEKRLEEVENAKDSADGPFYDNDNDRWNKLIKEGKILVKVKVNGRYRVCEYSYALEKMLEIVERVRYID